MVRPATDDDIRYVAAHMREIDAAEQFATRFPCDDERTALAADIIAAQGRAIQSFCFVGPDGNPAAILSAYLSSPGVARLHRVSTEQWDIVSIEVFRFGITKFMPAVKAAGIRRAECSILAIHDCAAAMLRRLGFAFEGTAWGRGRGGENFQNFAWVSR